MAPSMQRAVRELPAGASEDCRCRVRPSRSLTWGPPVRLGRVVGLCTPPALSWEVGPRSAVTVTHKGPFGGFAMTRLPGPMWITVLNGR